MLKVKSEESTWDSRQLTHGLWISDANRKFISSYACKVVLKDTEITKRTFVINFTFNLVRTVRCSAVPLLMLDETLSNLFLFSVTFYFHSLYLMIIITELLQFNLRLTVFIFQYFFDIFYAFYICASSLMIEIFISLYVSFFFSSYFFLFYTFSFPLPSHTQ